MHTRPAVSSIPRTRPLALLAAGALAISSADACVLAAPQSQPSQAVQHAAGEAIAPGSPAINAAWKSWREALDSRAAFLDPRELAAKAEQHKAWLIALDNRLPRFAAPTSGTNTWRANLASEGNSQRESALRRILARIEPQAPALDDPAVHAEVEAAERSLRSWGGRANLLAEDLSSIEKSLAEARTLEEGNTTSIRSLVEKWVHEGMTRQPGVRAAVAAVLDRVDALEKLEREDSTGEIFRSARAAAADKPELLFSAWRRLSNRGQSAWPSTESDLAAEVTLRPILLRAADDVPDRKRAQFLKDEVAMEQARRLTRLLSAAVDDPTLTAADTAIRGLGLSEQALDNRIRYNLLLNRLKRAVSAPGITDERSRALAKDFVIAARELQGGIAFLSGANTVVAALDAVGGGVALSPATVEPGRYGPAAAGLGVGVENGATLTFTLPPRSGVPEATLEFILVGEGITASYITTHEVTVGQVAAILAARNAERSLPTVLPTFRPLDDSRQGPRTWTWSRDGFDVPQIVPSPNWFSPIAVLGGVDYPNNQVPAPPSYASPMQHIPVSAAAYIASLAGCRFPTTGEWSALLDERAQDVRLELANLRDANWKALDDHMKAHKAAGRWSEPADAGAFQPAGAAIGTAGSSRPWDDGWLWFAPAAPAANEPVTHVLGNVAEFTTTQPWSLPSDPQPVADYVLKALGQLRVVGGSALSDPAIDPRIPQELDRIDAVEGFSDVGFRLAFGANTVTRPREQVGLQVIEILSPTPYLKPR